ncbi:zinc finger C2HC domain-containing protein 1C isoform X2 [Drosophila mojavensis]|uniref:Uncharacterized protein, isoform B n=1 Tax=Drosophila mojavensis TaxID=7230 RepID=B4K5F8_DROMO|nr:zinc finger C2HC domain-containing protein 1C isoform X2 [Drosophila mojavensis]XP_015023079.1 zinc finger C2HC domain-containing protein 1C isoform X2 [Drosophila mojavensis]EDW16184.2 uncharacterized protein Dmoj_GI22365, isoform B [Drosophila mojavensis]KRG01973.1 uncharacterized protein Dmoj_GI22365, isoform C [Drosophila mojavensis]
MASQDASNYPTSRLAQMRMRFQQKTQEEQEQRRQELNQAVTASPRAATSRLIGNGKVRQMFDERRRGAGIDRSNPLKPIGDSTRTHSLQQQQPQQLQHQQHQITKGLSTMSLKEKPVSGRNLTSDSNNNNNSSSSNNKSNNNNNKYSAAGTLTHANRLKPVITRKTPPKKEKEMPMRANSSPPSSARVKTFRSTAATATTRTATATATTPTMQAARSPNARAPLSGRGRVSAPKGRQVKPKSPVTKIQMDAAPPEGTKTCRFCGRHFNIDRLAKHEDVCQRTMNTKRKIFDAAKQRVKGTDNEKYNKGQQKSNLSRSQSTYSSAAQQKGLKTGVKKSNWRKKHEEFIEAIRAAKKVQAHLARGGKLSDLPPPPPSENPDYIQCPHCGRRFNEQAAERHIPRCATMEHNKPRKNPPQPPVRNR